MFLSTDSVTDDVLSYTEVFFVDDEFGANTTNVAGLLGIDTVLRVLMLVGMVEIAGVVAGKGCELLFSSSLTA